MNQSSVQHDSRKFLLKRKFLLNKDSIFSWWVDDFCDHLLSYKSSIQVVKHIHFDIEFEYQ